MLEYLLIGYLALQKNKKNEKGVEKGQEFEKWTNIDASNNVVKLLCQFSILHMNDHNIREISSKSHYQRIQVRRKMKYMKPLNLFKEVTNWKPPLNRPNRDRFLGLSINYNRVDLAVSDPDNKLAVPISAVDIQEGNMDLIAGKFKTLIRKHKLGGFVVEYPTDGPMIRCHGPKIKKFINDLGETGKFQDLKYTYWEDILETKSMDFVVKHNVEFILEHFNVHQPDLDLESKFIFSKFAAARLLQGFMNCANQPEHENDNCHTKV